MLRHRRLEPGELQPGSDYPNLTPGPGRTLRLHHRHRFFTPGTGADPPLPAPISVLGSRHRDRPAFFSIGTGTGSSFPA
ncbi:hypothetical protein GRJ2_002111500 [Grus japonensis]|uniref:Uncharacterized protein n=1 Tax=Grus japonensis TaxID=30415 RepID=A0ABC9XHB2_GRUJA